ncbi:MAG: hypothetical protein R3F40_07145 [Candidatus Competibacteraceae bacterium]
MALIDVLNEWLAGNPELKRIFALWIRAMVLRHSRNRLVLPKVRDLKELKMTLTDRFDAWIREYEQKGLEKGLEKASKKASKKGLEKASKRPQKSRKGPRKRPRAGRGFAVAAAIGAAVRPVAERCDSPTWHGDHGTARTLGRPCFGRGQPGRRLPPPKESAKRSHGTPSSPGCARRAKKLAGGRALN